MINVRMQSQQNRLKPKITVIGVGGAGGNAVNNMINSHLEGCEFLVCNTDAQAMEHNVATNKIQLGVNVTRGLGAGANPGIGQAAAEETIDEIMAYLDGSNMVFVTAGMGGGTGTGAAPVIAAAARQAGILTVGVVTKPFHFEGSHRMKLAEAGIAEMQKHVDTLIIIPNQNLFRVANEKTTFADAFRMADEVLQSGVRGVTDLMVMPGLINLDFADIRTVMAEMGKAMMGTGEAEGERRSVEAAEAAISNPLLDDVSMKGAKGVLINITGGLDMTLFEVDEAANRIRDEVDPDANIIFGSTFNEAMQGKIRVSVVATGIEAAEMRQPRPMPVSNVTVPVQQRAIEKPVMQAQSPRIPAGIQPQAHRMPVGGDYGGNYGGSTYMPAVGAPQPQQAPQQYGMTMRASQPVTSHAPVVETQPAAAHLGHAEVQAPAWSAAATARKLDYTEEQIDVTATQTKPLNPLPPAARTSSVAPQQPKAQLHGNAFIPPKPVDPKVPAHYGQVTEPAAEQAVVAPRKSPSLFERFTGKRDEVAPETTRTTAQPRLDVQAGGKKDDDELDIPAFLRRQAN